MVFTFIFLPGIPISTCQVRPTLDPSQKHVNTQGFRSLKKPSLSVNMKPPGTNRPVVKGGPSPEIETGARSQRRIFTVKKKRVDHELNTNFKNFIGHYGISPPTGRSS